MMEAWRQLTEGRSGWFWIVAMLRHGDIYHVCSLASAFADHYGRKDPIYLVVSRQSQADVAELFREEFAEIIIAGGLPIEPGEWDAFYAQTGLSRFACDAPLLPHPNYYPWGRPAIELMGQTQRTWMDIYKKLLRVPGESQPSFPSVKPDKQERAREFCASAGIPEGRSVILFPYAQSLPMQAQQSFARLALDLHDERFEVYTSVANDEAPIEGTSGLQIPFDILIEVVEHCGWVVAIRSGVCDITSSARCRRTYIYPSFSTLIAWSVSAMELARDVQEISYPFTGDPRHFSDLVRSRASNTPLATPPRRLSPLVACRKAASVRSVPFADLAGSDVVRLGHAVESGALDALVIFDIPRRDHPRLSREIAALDGGLLPLGGVSIYACRDDLPSCVFEEVGGSSPHGLQCAAGRYWHSLIVVSKEEGRRLADLLPDYARDALLMPSTRLSPNRMVRLGEYFGSAEHVDATSQARPLSLDGVQLLDGWSGLEPWGVWSEGLQPAIKVLTDEPLSPGTSLHFEVNGCVSPAFPRITVRVNANGRPAAVAEVAFPFHNSFEVPLGDGCVGETEITIVFRLDEVRSPAEQGDSIDHRKLGLGLVAIEMRNAARPLVRAA